MPNSKIHPSLTDRCYQSIREKSAVIVPENPDIKSHYQCFIFAYSGDEQQQEIIAGHLERHFSDGYAHQNNMVELLFYAYNHCFDPDAKLKIDEATMQAYCLELFASIADCTQGFHLRLVTLVSRIKNATLPLIDRVIGQFKQELIDAIPLFSNQVIYEVHEKARLDRLADDMVGLCNISHHDDAYIKNDRDEKFNATIKLVFAYHFNAQAIVTYLTQYVLNLAAYRGKDLAGYKVGEYAAVDNAMRAITHESDEKHYYLYNEDICQIVDFDIRAIRSDIMQSLIAQGYFNTGLMKEINQSTKIVFNSEDPSSSIVIDEKDGQQSYQFLSDCEKHSAINQLLSSFHLNTFADIFTADSGTQIKLNYFTTLMSNDKYKQAMSTCMPELKTECTVQFIILLANDLAPQQFELILALLFHESEKRDSLIVFQHEVLQAMSVIKKDKHLCCLKLLMTRYDAAELSLLEVLQGAQKLLPHEQDELLTYFTDSYIEYSTELCGSYSDLIDLIRLLTRDEEKLRYFLNDILVTIFTLTACQSSHLNPNDPVGPLDFVKAVPERFRLAFIMKLVLQVKCEVERDEYELHHFLTQGLLGSFSDFEFILQALTDCDPTKVSLIDILNRSKSKLHFPQTISDMVSLANLLPNLDCFHTYLITFYTNNLPLN